MQEAAQPRLRLYHYWRSSSSWRVRWAFALKGFQAEMVAVNLLSDEPESPTHRERNPMGFVPALEFLDAECPKERFLGESMAIIELAEEMSPSPSLLPRDVWARARIRQLAEIINAGTQPIQNLNVTQHLGLDPAGQKTWNAHWIRQGLQAYETLVQDTAGIYSFGDQLTLADLFLIPQCYNAIRFDVSLSEFPTIAGIWERAMATPSCQASHPDRFAPST